MSIRDPYKPFLMKQLLLLLLLLSLAGTASAQTVTVSPISREAIAVDPSWTLSQDMKPFPIAAANPQGEDLKLSYFNADGTIIPWQAAWQPDPNTPAFIVAGYSQRFTLPTQSGFLDSIHIVFSQVIEDVAGGQINVFIVKDEVVEPTGAGIDKHLPELTQTGILASAALPAAAFAGVQNITLTLKTNHLEVPQHFHVFLSPSVINNTYSARFVIPGDVKENTPTTTENSRSTFLYFNNTNPFIDLMDNFFQVSGNDVAVNFAMEAFVNVETGSVASNLTTPAAIYPNPVAINGMLTIEHPEQIASVRVVNMLGAEMQSWSGKSSSVQISTASLPAGVYNVIVNTENGVTTEKLVIN
jgi:hypothetical protein